VLSIPIGRHTTILFDKKPPRDSAVKRHNQIGSARHMTWTVDSLVRDESDFDFTTWGDIWDLWGDPSVNYYYRSPINDVIRKEATRQFKKIS